MDALLTTKAINQKWMQQKQNLKIKIYLAIKKMKFLTEMSIKSAYCLTVTIGEPFRTNEKNQTL